MLEKDGGEALTPFQDEASAELTGLVHPFPGGLKGVYL